MKNCVLLTVVTVKITGKLFHIPLVFSSVTVQTGSPHGSLGMPPRMHWSRGHLGTLVRNSATSPQGELFMGCLEYGLLHPSFSETEMKMEYHLKLTTG